MFPLSFPKKVSKTLSKPVSATVFVIQTVSNLGLAAILFYDVGPCPGAAEEFPVKPGYP